jgi:hypothetical protein
MDREHIADCSNAHPLEDVRLGAMVGSIGEQRDPNEMRSFLVACHLASVSVDAMAGHLELDTATIRSELVLGIDAWNAAQRRTREAASRAHLRVAAAH